MIRSRENTLAALKSLKVETNPAWQRRDVTGDGKPETFCNQAVEAACKLLEAPLPPGKLANEYARWLRSDDGLAAGWVNATERLAEFFAEQGFVVVGVLSAPGHGHIVMATPAVGGQGLHTWQAGRRNHENKPAQFSWSPEDLARVSWFVHS